MNSNTNVVFRLAPDLYDEDDNETMLEVYNAQSQQLGQYESIIYRIFLNNYVNLADVEGIRRFEAIFHIIADEETESLDFRRARIINKFSILPPFTKIFLRQLLDELFGEENVYMDIIYNDYKLQIFINTDIEKLFGETMKDIRQLIPANIVLEEYQANPYTHAYLNKNYTHRQLEQFDYRELSRYA